MKTPNNNSLPNQRGAVLAVSLIILLVLTLIGVIGMQNTTMEEKMASNMRDRGLAFYSAETGLLSGEAELRKAALPVFKEYATSTADGNYTPDSLLWNKVDWNSAEVYSYVSPVATSLAANPRFYLEELPAAKSSGALEAGTAFDVSQFRITAMGVGNTDTAVVILQTTFRR